MLGIGADGRLSAVGTQCLRAVASLVGGPSFVVGACGATIRVPVEQALEGTSQLRVFLQPPRLRSPPLIDGKEIVSHAHPIVRRLFDDSGGVGRAVEAAFSVMAERDNLDTCHWGELAHAVYARLARRFATSVEHGQEFAPILRAILSHQVLDLHSPVPGTKYRPDEIAQHGLVWVQDGRLHCPYFWLWIVARASRDPILAPWRFDDYEVSLCLS
jgi:hypothetical protein